jgi:SpoVK/Ycf46/Vps4 family AAA+-type ATPase
MVEVGWNSHEQKMEAFYINWKSNVTFDNRFFTGKKEIVDKINFFINNEEWYKEKGIPYTLGILLWGDPGCGKTSFIKALMNLTKRHGVDIKLSKKMNMNRLREIIYDDEITEEIIIPQDKRIILFEDIDAMCEIVMDRDIPKNNSEIDLEKKISDAIDSTMIHKNRNNFSLISKMDNNDNNNLSFFLNILDGINECPGRIIIMTTNKPEYLDKALIRPGRIDFKIHMTKATTSDIKEIIKFYWNIDDEIEINQEWSEKLTHAEIISFCRLTNNHYDTILYIEKFITDSQLKNELKNEVKNELKNEVKNEVKSELNSKKELKIINELLYNQPFY